MLFGRTGAALFGLGFMLTSARPLHAEPASAPGPDVRVTYVSKAAGTERTTYTFLVSNVGDGVADEVCLTHVTSLAAAGRRTADREQESTGTTIVSLTPRESMTIAVVCDALPGFACAGAELSAAAPSDTNARDNADRSH